jgi:hypothetical protein
MYEKQYALDHGLCWRYRMNSTSPYYDWESERAEEEAEARYDHMRSLREEDAKPCWNCNKFDCICQEGD